MMIGGKFLRHSFILCTALVIPVITPDLLHAQRPIKIMPVGDSLSSEGVFSGLQKLFVDAGFEGYEFVGPVAVEALPKPINRQAYGGAQLKDMLNGRTIKTGEFQKGIVQTIPEFHPDVILLMGGTNDIGSADVEGTKRLFSALLNRICQDAPEAIVFVSAIPSVHPAEQYGHLLPRIAELNAFIATETAARANSKIHYVEEPGRILTNADFEADGLHFAETGKTKISRAWFDALTSAGIVRSNK